VKVRRPQFDFSNTRAHWAPNAEFAQQFNATSLWIPHLERFLNRVVTRAGAGLDPDAPGTGALRNDIKMFIRQEAMHYTNHAAFNTILTRNGYDVAAFERHFEAEFERLFSVKSLAFLCAYCEGFETMGPPAAVAWLDGMDDLIEGADPEVVRLWQWHLLEEYEHRTVCHDVFHAVSGSYFIRVYGLVYQFFHLGRFSAMVLTYLFDRDRAAMTPEQIRQSKRRARAMSRRMMAALLPGVLRAMLPFYSPRKTREPRRFQSFRAALDAQTS